MRLISLSILTLLILLPTPVYPTSQITNRSLETSNKRLRLLNKLNDLLIPYNKKYAGLLSFKGLWIDTGMIVKISLIGQEVNIELDINIHPGKLLSKDLDRHIHRPIRAGIGLLLRTIA